MQEQEQLAQLTRMRRIATGLLLLMALIFVVARMLEATYPAFAYVGAFAEAAMVGAIADWFAVTALFRHPFGLRIPHTAIIPRNKDRIGASVAKFLEHNFMTHGVMSEELRQVDFAGAATHWLSQPENSLSVARQVVGGIPTLIHMIEDRDVARFIEARLADTLQGLRLAPLAADLLTVLVADQRHQAMFDRLLEIVAGGIEQHKDLIRKKIHERSPRWIPRTLDEKFFVHLIEELQTILTEMKSPDSEWRARFQDATQEWIVKLRSSPEIEAKISAMAGDLLGQSVFRQYIDSVWRDVKQRLLADADDPDSKMVDKLQQALQAFSTALANDKAVRSKLNTWIGGFIERTVVAHRGVIAGLVARVIRKWDGDTVARKFELYVGRDLQYIRINGTLVGGMVGLFLHVVALAL